MSVLFRRREDVEERAEDTARIRDVCDIDMIGRMGKKDIEKIWGEMKKLLIDPEASALVELVELREDIKIPIINIYDSPTPLSSDMIEIIKTLAKKLPIAILDKQAA